jgi:uncharacterized LabA/DUF88 family protein
MSIGFFVDGAYIYKAFGGMIDYTKLRRYLETELNDSVDEAYYFNATDGDASPRVAKFHNALAFPPPHGPGLRVKLYWLQSSQLYWPKAMGGGKVLHPQTGQPYDMKLQKAVDVGLVYHMTRSFLKRNWTKLVLAAGDADFHEPVQSLVQSENVDLYLVGSLASISKDLRPYARRIFEIDRDPLQAAMKYQFSKGPPETEAL